MDDIVYQRTKEQRDFWKERAEVLEQVNAQLTARLKRQSDLIDAFHASTSDAKGEY